MARVEEMIAAAREEGVAAAEDILKLPLQEKTPTTAREQADRMCAFVERRLPELGPDEDVIPMTELAGERGVVPVVHPLDDDDVKRAVFEGIVPEIAQAVGLRTFGQVMFAWTLPEGAAQPGEPGYVMPRDHPGRVEIAAVVASDGVVALTRRREIGRDAEGRPFWARPAWEAHETEAEKIGGDMVRPLLGAIHAHRLARATRLLVWGRPAEWWTDERRAAWRTMEHASDEGGAGHRDRRDIVKIRLEQLLEAGTALGFFEDGRMTDEVAELAARPDLWEIDVPDDDEIAEGLTPPWR